MFERKDDRNHRYRTYMADLGHKARVASRRLAAATTAEKNTALNAIADDLAGHRAELMAENRKDLCGRRRQGAGRRAARSLGTDRCAYRFDGRGSAPDRCAAGPDRSDLRYELSAQRHPGGSYARAVRCGGDHLRIPSQCDRRCGCPVPEVGKCHGIAGGLRGLQLQSGDCRQHPARTASRPACRRMPCRCWRPPTGPRWAA